MDVVKEIIRLNKQGMVVKDLQASSEQNDKGAIVIYKNAAGEDSITRFEEKQQKKRKRKRKTEQKTNNASNQNIPKKK